MVRSNARLVGPFAAFALLLLSRAALADPAAGQCVAASESAVQLREARRLRDAREQYLKCAAPSCPKLIRSECEQQLKDVTAALPTIVFEAKDGAGNDLTAVSIAMDGRPLVDHLDGAALAIDPGSHAFVFRMAGQPPVQKTFVVAEGEKGRREKIVIGAPPASPPPTPATAGMPAPIATPPPASPPPSSPPAAPSTPAAEEHAGWSTQHSMAVASLGLGVAGVAVGTIFGLQTNAAWSKSQSECVTSTNCPDHAAALSDRDTAGGDRTIAYVGFGVGVAALVGAGVLWFTSPSLAPPSPSPSPSSSETGRVVVVPALTAREQGLVVRGEF